MQKGKLLFSLGLLPLLICSAPLATRADDQPAAAPDQQQATGALKLRSFTGAEGEYSRNDNNWEYNRSRTRSDSEIKDAIQAPAGPRR